MQGSRVVQTKDYSPLVRDTLNPSGGRNSTIKMLLSLENDSFAVFIHVEVNVTAGNRPQTAASFRLTRGIGSRGSGLISLRAERSSLLIPNSVGATMAFSVFRFCFHFTSSNHKAHSLTSSSRATAQNQIRPLST